MLIFTLYRELSVVIVPARLASLPEPRVRSSRRDQESTRPCQATTSLSHTALTGLAELSAPPRSRRSLVPPLYLRYLAATELPGSELMVTAVRLLSCRPALSGLTGRTMLGTSGTQPTLVCPSLLVHSAPTYNSKVSFDITIDAGDSIKMTVTATSTSAGSATIENVTKGTTVTKKFSGESDKLCEYDAEWIVEDFEECTGSSCSLVPFGNFGTVEFTAATATINGATVTAADASILDIEQSSKVLTSCSASGSTVTCKYV